MGPLILQNSGIVKPTMLSYLWEVNNFSFVSAVCNNVRDYSTSPAFPIMHADVQQEWRLHLYPNGHTQKTKKYISIFLKYLGQSNVEVNVTLSLLDDKYCKVTEKSFQKLFVMGSSVYGLHEYAEQNFITDETNHVLVNNKLQILCEIIYDSKLATLSKAKCSEETLPDYCRLKEFDEFENLLKAENSADVIIKIGKDEIKVHKAIIMSRSPVFQAMFEHNMKEKEQSVVEITDIKYEVMKEVIRFMYVGKVNEVEKIADDLLLAAEKYSMKGLKILTEKQLFKNLNTSNAIQYLRLADLCNAINLKSQILKFIVQNQKDVVHKPELQLLPMEVVCEVLRAVVDSNSNK